jgi:hypothetical protein
MPQLASSPHLAASSPAKSGLYTSRPRQLAYIGRAARRSTKTAWRAPPRPLDLANNPTKGTPMASDDARRTQTRYGTK